MRGGHRAQHTQEYINRASNAVDAVMHEDEVESVPSGVVEQIAGGSLGEFNPEPAPGGVLGVHCSCRSIPNC